MSERLLKINEVEHKVGLSRSMIYKMMKAGQFPQVVKLGSASTWDEGEINQFILDRKAARFGDSQPRPA